MAFEIPLETKRIEADAEGSIGGLKNQEDGDRIDGVFEAAAENAGKMRTGENPSVAETGVEGGDVAATAGNGVSAASPNLEFGAAFLRRGQIVSLGGASEVRNHYDCDGEQSSAHENGSRPRNGRITIQERSWRGQMGSVEIGLC